MNRRGRGCYRRRVRKIAVAVAVATLIGCAHGTAPCASPNACSAGEECLANRCIESGAAPAHGSQRLVLEPSELAVIAQNTRPGALPAGVTFGSAALGKSALYLKFPLDRRRAVESAFLLLEPLPDSPVDGREIEVEAWRVRKPWNERSLRWTAQPGLALPKALAVARSAPRQPLRVDVTEIVRHLSERVAPAHDYGLALTASAGDGHGATFATGAGGGRAPRLEIYVR